MNYFRIGNRTLTQDEMTRLRPADIEKIKQDSELANEKRLENIRKSLGVKTPQAVTLDVTPAGIAARNAAIAAEEAKIAAEKAASEQANTPQNENEAQKDKKGQKKKNAVAA